MAVLKSGTDAPARPIETSTDDALEAIDRVVDYTFWQLMLADDLDQAEKDLELLHSALRLRWAAVKASARDAELDI